MVAIKIVYIMKLEMKMITATLTFMHGQSSVIENPRALSYDFAPVLRQRLG